MPIKQLISGQTILKDGEEANLPVGQYWAHFVPKGSTIETDADFVVEVPFNLGVSRVSTSTFEIDTSEGKHRLLVVMLSAGARGEIVSATYSLARVW